MEHTGTNVMPVREPDPVYTPSARKALGFNFKGRKILAPYIVKSHKPELFDAASFCELQDQILWLTERIAGLEAGEIRTRHQARCTDDAICIHAQNFLKINEAITGLTNRVTAVVELETKDIISINKDVIAVNVAIKTLNQLVGEIFAERGARAKVTPAGVEAAMSGRARPKRKKR